MKKLNESTKQMTFTSHYSSAQSLPQSAGKSHLLSYVISALLLILPALASAQTSISDQRNLDKNLYEKCFTSDFGSSEESENCTTWITQSACNGVYVDNRGDIESFTARENLLNYLREADKQAAKTKGCDPMGQRRLIMSLIARDKNVSDGEQLKRWDRILKDMPKLLPEQRLFICETAAQSDQFSALMSAKNSRNAIALCLKDVSGASADELKFLEMMSLEAPELINADAMAALAIHDISVARYETARNRLDEIDLKQLSPKVRENLLARVAPVGQVLYKDGFSDVFRPHIGFDLKATPRNERRLALWQACMDQKNAPVAWFAELEAVLLLQKGDTMGVAKRAVKIASASNSKEVSEYLKKLMHHASATRNLVLFKRLALEFGSADPNARNAISKEAYSTMAKSILDMTDITLQLAQSKGKAGASDVTEEDIHVLRALVRLADDGSKSAVQLRLGEVLAFRGNTAEALKLWYEVVETGKKHAEVEEAWFLAIVTLRQTKQQAEADKQLEAFENRYPASAWIRLLK